MPRGRPDESAGAVNADELDASAYSRSPPAFE